LVPLIAASGGPLIIIVALLALVWIFLIRPQKRRQVRQSSMLDNIAAGDEILTAGGFYGYVRSIDDDQLTVEIAPGTNVRVARRAVAAVIPPDEPEDEVPEDEPAEGSPSAEAVEQEDLPAGEKDEVR
jgi:preprotein translocase subunit YajC